MFHFHQESVQFFTFCLEDGVICISEVIYIFPGNLILDVIDVFIFKLLNLFLNSSLIAF